MARQKRDPESVVREVKRKTRKKFNAEEKIRIVLEGLKGETSVVDLCRREGIYASMYYKWSKDFLEAGKRRLNGDTKREATSDEVIELKTENDNLKFMVAELTMRERYLKKSLEGLE